MDTELRYFTGVLGPAEIISLLAVDVLLTLILKSQRQCGQTSESVWVDTLIEHCLVAVGLLADSGIRVESGNISEFWDTDAVWGVLEAVWYCTSLESLLVAVRGGWLSLYSAVRHVVDGLLSHVDVLSSVKSGYGLMASDSGSTRWTTVVFSAEGSGDEEFNGLSACPCESKTPCYLYMYKSIHLGT